MASKFPGVRRHNKLLGALVILLPSLMVTNFAYAGPIISRATGLAAPTHLIDFSEVALADGTVVTNQFASLGVSNFTGLFYNGCPSSLCVTPPPDGADPRLTNWSIFDSDIDSHEDFSITFSGLVTEAAFAFASDFGAMTFNAFLGSGLLETFTVNVDDTSCNGTSGWCYYGFEGGGAFDRITVQTSNEEALIDNLQFTSATVPVPATLTLLGFGLVGIGYQRRKQIKAA